MSTSAPGTDAPSKGALPPKPVSSSSGFLKRLAGSIFRARVLVPAGVCLALFAAWLVFPRPDPGLWPPAVCDDANVVYVSLGEIHSAIDIPDRDLGMFQEWHMGTREWYLERCRSWPDILKTILFTADGVIRFGVFAYPYGERQGFSPDRVFKFWLSDEGRRRLLARLHRDRGELIERRDDFWYYTCRRRYHLLANCNNFVGAALQEAGLPIRESLSFELLPLAWQLRRCLRFQEEARTKKLPSAEAEGRPGTE